MNFARGEKKIPVTLAELWHWKSATEKKKLLKALKVPQRLILFCISNFASMSACKQSLRRLRRTNCVDFEPHTREVDDDGSLITSTNNQQLDKFSNDVKFVLFWCQRSLNVCEARRKAKQTYFNKWESNLTPSALGSLHKWALFAFELLPINSFVKCCFNSWEVESKELFFIIFQHFHRWNRYNAFFYWFIKSKILQLIKRSYASTNHIFSGGLLSEILLWLKQHEL